MHYYGSTAGEKGRWVPCDGRKRQAYYVLWTSVDPIHPVHALDHLDPR
jgi:hypothetical protein